MSGRKSKNKGYRGEKEFADLTGGRRVPLSGAAAHAGEEFGNDVILPNGMKVEVKRRAEMEKTLYGWLLDEREKPDLVAFRADHKPWIISMTLDQFARLMNIEIAAKDLLNQMFEEDMSDVGASQLIKAVMKLNDDGTRTGRFSGAGTHRSSVPKAGRGEVENNTAQD
jgi:hypothetical protein